MNNPTTLIEQLRQIIAETVTPPVLLGTVEAVTGSSLTIRSNTGAVVRAVPVVGGSGGLAFGDPVHLLRAPNGGLVALNSQGSTGSTGSTAAAGSSTLDWSALAAGLAGKADLNHVHVPPSAVYALSGVIGGWSIGAQALTAFGVTLHQSGYIALGAKAAVPSAYGAHVGVFLGYDSVGDQAQLSLYGLPGGVENYLEWDGSKLLIKATNFTLDAGGSITASNVTLSGAITATTGAIGHWQIAANKLQSVSASIVLDADAESITLGAGLLLDGANQRILVGAANPRILIDGGARSIQTNTFQTGVTGWQVKSGLGGAPDSAEFENITARGEFRASVLAFGELHAMGGTFVALTAAPLFADVTTS